jgi:diadenosine tetraphosphate (Ap4A) HIT family hydrolase
MNTLPVENCEICDIQPTIPPELVIDENELWTANLGWQDQSCLGRTYVTLKRHASELDELTRQEEESFIVIRNGLIRAIRLQFEPITFNVSCLKNDAFRHDPDTTPPSDAHVHWHVVPRYGTRPIAFAGETFQDPNPGRYLAGNRERKPVSQEVAMRIAGAIQAGYTAR